MRRINTAFGPVVLLGLAVAIGAGVGGCTRAGREPPSSWAGNGVDPSLPMEAFTTYESAFRYIAANEGLPQDQTTLFELAADSTLERMTTEQTGDLLIIRADHYGNSRYGSRGAQGQGRYYVFRVAGRRWELVGVLLGNGYRWNNVGRTVQIVTWWHMSADESPETTYTWNGTIFE